MKAIVASFGIAFAVQAFGQERIETAPPPPPEARAEGYGKQYGLFPNVPLVFGPKLTIGFIQPVTVGIEAKYANLAGLSFDFGFVPDITIPSTSPSVKVNWSSWNVAAKVYPFRGSFFLGAALGGRSFTGKTADVTGNYYASVTSTFILPEIGWRWVTRSGLFFGMEFGWQFVLSYTADFRYNDIPVPTSANKDLQDAAKFIGEQGLPHLGLFTIGYLF